MKFNILKIPKKALFPIIIVFFVIWMLFVDSNSYIYQREYNQEIEKLEKSIDFYETEIKNHRETIDKLSSQKNLDIYAREKYHYKKENEHIYLIEYDTIE